VKQDRLLFGLDDDRHVAISLVTTIVAHKVPISWNRDFNTRVLLILAVRGLIYTMLDRTVFGVSLIRSSYI